MHIANANTFAGLEEFVSENEPLAPFTWYKIGGPARYFVRPRNVEELQEAARRCVENEIRVYVLGLGAKPAGRRSGCRWGGFPARSGTLGGTSNIKINICEAGAGVDLQRLVLRTCRQGMAGIECLAGIPGTIGGGIRMNAGGKFGDIGGVVSKVQVMSDDGTLFERTKDDLVFDYRSTNISATFILGATLELDEDDPEVIMRKTKEIGCISAIPNP